MNPEEGRVELVRIGNDRTRAHIVGAFGQRLGVGDVQFCRREMSYRFRAVYEVAPELRDVARTRKTSGHADDGYVGDEICHLISLLEHHLPAPPGEDLALAL